MTNVELFCVTSVRTLMTDIDYLQETIGSILKQIDNAGRFKTLGLSRNQKPFDVDQTDILHNLVNGTGIDTPMEAFLYGKFRKPGSH
jgi:hypothetical protein